MLDRTGIDPARVGLEVSEDAFVKAPVGGDALLRLKEMGVRLLLDDVDGALVAHRARSTASRSTT